MRLRTTRVDPIMRRRIVRQHGVWNRVGDDGEHWTHLGFRLQRRSPTERWAPCTVVSCQTRSAPSDHWQKKAWSYRPEARRCKRSEGSAPFDVTGVATFGGTYTSMTGLCREPAARSSYRPSPARELLLSIAGHRFKISHSRGKSGGLDVGGVVQGNQLVVHFLGESFEA